MSLRDMDHREGLRTDGASSRWGLGDDSIAGTRYDDGTLDGEGTEGSGSNFSLSPFRFVDHQVCKIFMYTKAEESVDAVFSWNSKI